VTTTSRTFVALVSGLALGIVLSLSRHPALIALALDAEPIGTLWVNAIRMTVIPLVVSLLVTGIAATGPSAIGRIGGRGLLVCVVLLASATAFAILVAPPLVRALPLDPLVLHGMAGNGLARPEPMPPFSEWVVSLIPANPVKAAADGAMLPIVIATALFALAVTRIGEAQRQLVIQLFRAIADATFVLVGWILLAAPIGVFALALTLGARGGINLAGALGQYVVLVSALLVSGTLALYPVARLAGGVPIRRFARALLPVQTLALSTRSSLACLPAMIEGAESLGLPADVVAFALPVAVSVFKFGGPIARVAGAMFVARLWGIPLGPTKIVAMSTIMAAMTFYTPGIPNASILSVAPVYIAFGLPVEGMGLLLAVDLVPDMFLTTANVTGDMTVATILACVPDTTAPN
jgi:proton glutamate symport protein